VTLGLVLDADQAQARVVDHHDQHPGAEAHGGLELERPVGHSAVAGDRDREPVTRGRDCRRHREPHRREPVGDQEPSWRMRAPEPRRGEHVRARVDRRDRVVRQLLVEDLDDPPRGQCAVGADPQRVTEERDVAGG